MSRRLGPRALAAILGAALLGYLIRRAGPATLLESLHRLGWGLALIIALGGVSHLMKTWAWRLTLAVCGAQVSWVRMFQLRLMSEAAGQIGALGQLFGEGVRVSALSEDIPIDSRVSSVTLDRALFIVAGAMISVIGVAAALLVVPLTDALRLYAILFAIIVVGLLWIAAVAVVRRWPFLSASGRALGRIRYIGGRVQGVLPVIESVEKRLFEFHRSAPVAFWASLLLNLVCHGLAVLEVYLVLFLLGVDIGLLGALVFEAVTKLVNIAGTLNPGNIGTYEGGNILIARMFALPASVGLAVAVARRARAIFWAAAGSLCFLFLSRNQARRGSDQSSTDLAENSQASEANGEISRSLTAFIFLNETGSPLLRVGTLPILLRTIIGIRRAGATRIIVYADAATRRKAERELLEIGRLPRFVEWIEPGSVVSLPRLLRQVLYDSRAHELLVMDGMTTYYPALFRKASEWIGDGALSLTTAGEPIGINVLSACFARDAADLCPSDVHTFDELQSWLALSPQVQREEVQPESWQRVVTPEDRIAAERKLDQWLVKPTDGVFARMNRRVSIPISRQLVKLPITANMVSLFTLGVGFLAAIFFARGGYWNMLVGAILSVWASILDGCDGEVARLKLMESAFGCWLETVCDWLYYLFIFSGMAIGLSKAFRPATFTVWGIMLVFGAVMSFLVTGLGRHKLAKDRPEEYLKIWQANAEKRRSNPILYIGRHMEFIIRRCFLPYLLLFFALLNIMKAAFAGAAIGTNVVWLMSLYSYGAFARVRGPGEKGVSVSPDPVIP
ncbi:MAG: flippase-like domain-containing protein [Silvibacterium sp.]|nr:flippase-like domain-containing protein [Silvibacterium sp.]